MTEFQRICLVHYHEIGLKGHNRSTFEMRLLKNLEALLKPFPVVVIHRIAGRLCVFLREGTDWTTAKEAADVIGKVPGVARVSCGFKCERDLDEMTEAALAAMAEAGEFDTFKVAEPHRFRHGFDGHEPDHRLGAVRREPREVR